MRESEYSLLSYASDPLRPRFITAVVEVGRARECLIKWELGDTLWKRATLPRTIASIEYDRLLLLGGSVALLTAWLSELRGTAFSPVVRSNELTYNTACTHRAFLLASGGVNADQLSSTINAVNLTGTFEPLLPLSDTDVEVCSSCTTSF